MKAEVVAILVAEKELAVAAVAAKFDGIIEQVNALEEGGSPDVSELQLKVAELEAALVAKQAEFEADEVQDEAALAAKQVEADALKAKLDQIKALLEG